MTFERHALNLDKMNKSTKKIVKMGLKFKAIYYDARFYKTLLLAVSFLVICPVLRKKMPKPDLVQN